MLKSGKYIIEPAGCATSSPSFTIRDTSGKFVTSIFPSAYVLRSERSLKPTLNFDNFGATYVLTSLRGPAGRYSIRLLPTRRHAELARRSGPGTYVVNLMKAK